MRIAFLDRERAIVELGECARRLLSQDLRVVAVGLFGSLVRGEALPSSDADVLILLESHPESRWFDRIPEYAEAFRGTSLPVEPFPYTQNEVNALISRSRFLRTAVQEVMPLAGAAEVWSRLRDTIRKTRLST